MPSSTFIDAGVPASLVRILNDRGITTPSPIQAATLPDSLAGRDLLGRGRTGSGKTYAFLLPLVVRLAASDKRPVAKRPRALILAPTRELVTQIEESLAPLAEATGLRVRTVFGGVRQNAQVSALAAGVDVLVACPGRLEDLVRQGLCQLDRVEITVLDEADHMADLGFLPGVRRLLDATPKDAQRLFFSATLDNAVGVLVKRFMNNPVTHESDPATSPVAKMEHHVLRIDREQKLPVLVDLARAPGRTVIFTRTKHGAKALSRKLNESGVPTVELHGNLAQNARTRNMDAFHSGEATTLVATDIAARGIHVDDVALVIHADPPAEHKAYLHRSGRTARAGSAGLVITLMTPDQTGDVRALTRAAGIKPTTTSVSGPQDAALAQLVPGERVVMKIEKLRVAVAPPAQNDGRQARPAGSGAGSGAPAGRRRRRGGSGGSAAASGSGSAARSGGGSAGGNRSSAPKQGQPRRTPAAAGSSSAGGGSHSAASFSGGGRRRGR